MHLVIVHGYILSGTGSNIYTANIAKTWKQQGHSVTVLCQDPFADQLDFVNEHIVGTAKIPASPPPKGTVRVVVPDIGGLLPVFVEDRYEGYKVKTLLQCTLEEIDEHIEATAKGLKKVLEPGASLVLTNHILLSPAIARRAVEGTSIPYVCKLHGSAMIFALKPRSEDLKPYAIEGLQHCHQIIAGTQHIADQVLAILDAEKDVIGLHDKLSIIPPGFDPGVFLPGREIDEKQQAFLASVAEYIKRKPNGRNASKISLPPFSSKDLHKELISVADSYDQRAIDADLPERWVPFQEGEPIICYFGKFLDTKGVGELLTAFPSVLDRIPEARLLLIGFGTFREHLEGMLQALKEGDVDAFRAYGNAGSFAEFPGNVAEKYFRKLRPEEQNKVIITGCQEHAQLGHILPLASVCVMSSKAAEAFGMVSVEAMAAGVLPVCNGHSGLIDVLDTVKTADPELANLMQIKSRPGGVHGTADGAYMTEQLPDKIVAALRFLYPDGFTDTKRCQEVSDKLRKIAISKFSWNGICKSILDLAN